MNSPSLRRVGDEIVCVYENLVEESTYCFGSKLLKDGNAIDLEETEERYMKSDKLISLGEYGI